MDTPLLNYFLALVLAYIIGSFPTAYLTAKRLMGIDIREHGSGNAGATNVWRVVGKKAGVFVLLTDFFKGFLPVTASQYLFPSAPALHVVVAIGTILGHSRSLFLGFTGGKSAITGLGGMMALAPVPAVLIGAVAFIVIKFTRYVSVGSMTAAVFTPIILYVLKAPLAYTVYGLLSALYVIYLHRANIGRLLKGTENRI